MRNLNIICIVLLLSPVGGSNVYTQGKSPGLLAEPYPGSMQETRPGVTDAAQKKVMEARSRTYYSKDPSEKIMAYYAAQLHGTFTESPEGNHIHTLQVIPFNEVNKIVTKRGGEIGEGGNSFYGGTSAGVTISGAPTNGSTHSSVTNTLDRLAKAYLARYMDADQADPEKLRQRLQDPELKKAQEQYAYLQTAYFMETTEKRTDNLPGTMMTDEVIYEKYYSDPAARRAKELEELQKKYTDAVTKMQYDEAAKLSDRIVKLSGLQDDPKDDWQTALQCLEELAQNAYLSRIDIDMHPSGWDLATPKE